jgi:DNA cross-link repair 1C protein
MKVRKFRKFYFLNFFFFFYFSDISITVTCFGAGHCPGSLMLLFEGSNGTILYTGDFRLYSHQSNRHRIILSKKLIDTLYIDMTFFEPSIRQLPEREQACQKLIQFIQQYDQRIFYLKTSARVGYEYIYISLYQHFRLLIHVNSEQYHLYDCLPQVQQALTINASSTRLHACWPRCLHTKSSIKVILSVLWFTLQQQQQFKSPLIQISTDYYRLCYSLHSSYNEICIFVKQISPTRVHPIALPDRITPERFNELLKQLGINQSPKICFTSNNTEQQIKRRYQIIENNNIQDDDELDFNCHENRENNEKQLFKRISNLQQQSVTKKCK